MIRQSDRERLIVRREKRGAYVFDGDSREVFRIDEETLTVLNAVLNGAPPGSNASQATGQFLNEEGRPLYQIIDPLSKMGVTPAPSALLAPNRIYLELTRRCLQRCISCYNAAGDPLPDELRDDDWAGLITELADAGVFEFRFTGGEPTTCKSFLPLLDLALATGRYVSVGTCGIMSRRMLDGLASRPVDEIIVSYQGPEKVHDAFTGIPGSHQKTLHTLHTLKDAGRKMRLNLTLTKTTYPTIEDAFALADELGIPTINLIHARPLGRGRNLKDCLTPEENLDHNRRLANIRRRHKVRVMTDFDLLRPEDEQAAHHPITERSTSCPAGREFAFISPEGYVFPCGVAPVAHVSRMTQEERRLFLAGSIREGTFLDLWHTSSTWIPYRDLAQCKPDACRRCRFWGRKCYGSCPVGAYLATGTLTGSDPYCYAHLLPG